MPNEYRHVNPGEKWKPSAKMLNTLKDVAKVFRAETGFAQNGIDVGSDSRVWIVNDTGDVLRQFAVVGKGLPTTTPSADESEVKERKSFRSAAPTDDGIFFITQEPAEADTIVEAVAHGLTKAYVDVSDTTHEYAAPVDDDYNALASQAAAGPARIYCLHLPADTFLDAIDDVTTSVTVTSSTGWPAVPFVITVEDEDLNVTAIDGNEWTVERGHNGTTPASHADATQSTFTSGVILATVLLDPNHDPDADTPGITSINGETGPAITHTVGTGGTDHNIDTSTDTIIHNIPDASTTARGLVTTGAQTFDGAKTFWDDVTLDGSQFYVRSSEGGTTYLHIASHSPGAPHIVCVDSGTHFLYLGPVFFSTGSPTQFYWLAYGAQYAGFGAVSDGALKVGVYGFDACGNEISGGLVTTIAAGTAYKVGGTDVSLGDGGTGASLADPGADCLLGWDDTDGTVKFFTIGSGLSYDAGTDTLSATGGASDAADVTYTPAVLTDWDGDADPGDVDNALDQLAERVDDLEGADGNFATKELNNLSAVAINVSLISDTDITDDLGSAAIRWRDIYAATLRTGDTATDTLLIQARDVDGAAWTTFITLTAGDTPTCDLNTAVTIGTAYIYRVGGTDVSLADGGTGASLADPGADRIMFWDDSAGAVTWLEVGTGLSITGTTISATGSGDVVGPASSTDNAIARWDGTTGKLLQDSGVTIDDFGVMTASGVLLLDQSGAGPQSLALVTTENLTANRALVFIVNDANRSLTVSGNADVSGSNHGGANPTGTIGLSAVNGTATTFLRSDGAPALSQSIAPTWTGNHTFSGNVIDAGGATSFEIPNGTGPTVNADGEIAIDTNTDNSVITQGSIIYFSTVQMYVIATDALPASDGQVLTYDGTGKKYVWSSAGAGDVTAASNITDNRLVRGDGGAKGIQESGITCDDSDNLTGVASITVGNTGLRVFDTDASHDLIFKPGSNLTADHTLTITTGDADRTLDISAASLTVSAFGATLVDDADAATARATLGATTVGGNIYTVANPSAIRFLRVNADNTVTLLSDSDFRTAIGAGTGGGDVTAAANIGDNRLVRGDGGAKGIQESGITVDDSDNVTGIVALTVDVLRIRDTDVSHYLAFLPGSNLTANRTLTITTGDADRTLTINASTTLGGGTHSGTNTGDQTTSGTANEIDVATGSGNPVVGLADDIIVPTSITIPNTGLHLLDTDASHDLIIKPGSNLSADRTLTITMSADRTLQLDASLTVTATAAISGTNTGDEAVIVLRDEKSSGTNGGSSTSGSWQTRTLNTEVIDTGGHCSLASNQFTLTAGTYTIWASAPCLSGLQNQIRLQNVTDTATVLLGGNAYSENAATQGGQDDATLYGQFTIAASKALEIQHRVTLSQATNGYGVAHSFGTEIYTTVILKKVG